MDIKDTREEVIINDSEKIVVSSYDDELLEMYRKIFKEYDNFEILSYSKELVHKESVRYLWLGEGLFSQRMFYVDGKDDLSPGEAYYLKGNKGVVIKSINYE